jgi:hypothetical protein
VTKKQLKAALARVVRECHSEEVFRELAQALQDAADYQRYAWKENGEIAARCYERLAVAAETAAAVASLVLEEVRRDLHLTTPTAAEKSHWTQAQKDHETAAIRAAYQESLARKSKGKPS